MEFTFIIKHHQSIAIQRFRINATEFDRERLDLEPKTALADGIIQINGKMEVSAPLGNINAELEAVGTANRGGSFNIERNSTKLIKPTDKDFVIAESGRVTATVMNIPLS